MAPSTASWAPTSAYITARREGERRAFTAAALMRRGTSCGGNSELSHHAPPHPLHRDAAQDESSATDDEEERLRHRVPEVFVEARIEVHGEEDQARVEHHRALPRDADV